MKVKELITNLLEFDMNSDVKLAVHTLTGGNYLSGYWFDIKGFDTFGTNTTEIVFEDWREDDEEE